MERFCGGAPCTRLLCRCAMQAPSDFMLCGAVAFVFMECGNVRRRNSTGETACTSKQCLARKRLYNTNKNTKTELFYHHTAYKEIGALYKKKTHLETHLTPKINTSRKEGKKTHLLMLTLLIHCQALLLEQNITADAASSQSGKSCKCLRSTGTRAWFLLWLIRWRWWCIHVRL